LERALQSNSASSYFGFATGQTIDFRLERPDGLSDEHWNAISAYSERLGRAVASNDLPLCIGTAKELVEAVAKVVLEARGKAVTNKADFTDVLTQAHVQLDRQPGAGLSTEPPVRDIAQGVKKIASQLGVLRNAYGTGHGRPYDPEVEQEIALASIDAALLWTRWGLRRLRPLILGSPTALARDLLGGTTFYRGTLTERLHAARLAEIELADQRVIGLAVARRAMRDTFVVQEEGVERCAETHDLQTWPLGYREGLLEGLFIGIDGRLDATSWSVGQAALLLNSLPQESPAIAELAEKCNSANYSQRLDDDVNRTAALTALRSAEWVLPSWADAPWKLIISRMEIPF